MQITKSILILIIVLISMNTSNAQTTVPLESIPASMKKSLNELFDGYLNIENALLKGSPEESAAAAGELNKLVNALSADGLTYTQKKVLSKQVGKIIYNTEHLVENPHDYDHQCEHFDYLSDEFYALLTNFKFNEEKIYYNYTADGNEGNSAHWLTNKDSMDDPFFKGEKKSNDKQVEIIQPK